VIEALKLAFNVLIQYQSRGRPSFRQAQGRNTLWDASRDFEEQPLHGMDRLRSFVEVEQDALAAAFEKLDAERWATEVVTAQGRHVTAAALPWLRTREVWVHAADLPRAADFPDFPPPLLDELIADVLRWRRDAREEALQVRPTDRDTTPPFDGQVPPVWIEGRTADLARWLTGRGAANIRASGQSALPTLGPWL